MTARRAIPFSACAALLLAVPPFLPPYPLTLLTQILIFAIFAMSLDLLLGYTGLASLGHAAYFGIAAYVVAILATRNQASFWACLGAAILAATAVAAVFGFVAIRAVGVYFLMITLALGMVIWGLAFRWVSLTMGDNGISGIARPSILPGWSLARPVPFHYLTLFAFFIAFALLSVVVRSPFGLSLRGLRHTQRRMGAPGSQVWLHKHLAFVLS